MATLGLKEMGKFFWEGREKVLPCWLSQFSFAKLRQPTGQTFLDLWKMQRKTWYSILGWTPRHASFPQKPVVKAVA
jgi:hypothetical protein